MNKLEKAVVTVIGKNSVGILSKTSTALANANADILDVSQSVLDNYFCMILIADITNATKSIDELQTDIRASCREMKSYVMHEDVFNSMHRI